MARLDNLDYEVNGGTVNYEIVPEIAPLFNATTAYAAGDQVIHEGIRCKFITAHPAGAWIGTDVEEMPTVAEELTSHGADITELKADLTSMDSKIAATQITNTVSGAIASFDDGADDVPVKDLVVDIEPVQDLHGQANPYPAGGGKNLFGGEYNVKWVLPTPLSVHNGDTFTVSTSVPASGNPRINIYTGEGGATRWYNAGINDTVNNRKVKLLTFTEDVTITAFMVDAAECTNIQIESGSTATAYAPYSNICPITGWTGANVSRTGLNQWDEVWEAGGINNSGEDESGSNRIRSKNYIHVVPGAQYYVNFTDTGFAFYPKFYDSDKNYVGLLPYFTHPSIITVPNNACYLRFFVYKSNWSAGYGTDLLININLSDPAKNGMYEPYQGNTYSITFPTEAGTVYGGTLDVTSGVLTVGYALATVDDIWVTGNINRAGTGRIFYIDTSDRFARGVTVGRRSNYLIPATYISSYEEIPANSFNVVGENPSKNAFLVCSNDPEDTLATFKQWFADNNIQLLLPLKDANKLSYQLTPTEVATLLGQNNIWADCGDTTVDYRADTKLYIENLTAPSEDDMVANTNIPNATYFMVGNTLYLSTTTIPAGDVINPGTNCTKMDLAAALNAINA